MFIISQKMLENSIPFEQIFFNTFLIVSQKHKCISIVVLLVFNLYKNASRLYGHLIYGKLPKISSKLIQRRVQFAGHCYRAKDEIISSLMFWTPPGPNRSNRLTYPGVISRDTDLMIQDLPVAMADRAVWRGVVKSLPAEAAG